MGIRYQPKYPDAESKKAQYQAVGQKLDECIGKVKSAAFVSISGGTFKEEALKGKYNEIYTGKVDSWVKDACKVKNSFESFYNYLQSARNTISQKVDFWNGRIGEMEAVDDGEPD